MAQVHITFTFLLAVIASSFLSRLLPAALPRPVVQIVLGAAFALFTGLHADFDPEVFFLLLVPPLLFLDGWRLPKDAAYRDRWTIAGLALGLVFLNVLGIGVFVHWLIPTMPLGVAFAFAAVVSPTDPIAVSAIAQRIGVPPRLMHILEGESLLNDASGLVCLNFAIAAVLTGTFSIGHASLSFLWMACGGLFIGTALTFVVIRGKARLGLTLGDDPGSNILVALMIPFGAYMLGERAGASGILAAVAAGVAMSFVTRSDADMAGVRIRSRAVWDMIEFTMNGIIFVLLGEQLPLILRHLRDTAAQAGHANPLWLFADVLAIIAALAALRFAWTWLSVRLTLFRRRRSDPGAGSPPIRIVGAMSVAGARGALTLAGVLTLPVAMGDGTPFPTRNLAIFLATSVILVSLLVASIGLPLLLRGLKLPDTRDARSGERRARVTAAEAAIARIEDLQHDMARGRDDADVLSDIASRLMDFYRARIDAVRGTDDAEDDQALDAARERLQRAAMAAEREAIVAMRRKREIGSELSRKLIHEIDLVDARLS